jgi:hypothetical protein
VEGVRIWVEQLEVVGEGEEEWAMEEEVWVEHIE